MAIASFTVKMSKNSHVEEPKPKPGREEEAKLALEHTQIARGTGWLLTLAFLLTIFLVPLMQALFEVKEGRVVFGGALDAARELPSWAQIRSVGSWQDAWALIPPAGRFKTHEEKLEDDSVVAQWLLPRASGLLLRAGVGNEQVYLGATDSNGKRWLFHRPDVDYLSGKGFNDPAALRQRERTTGEGAPPNGDSIGAISDFCRQLEARNIRLILMPVPVKPMLEAERLLPGNPPEMSHLQNAAYRTWAFSMVNEVAPVYEPTPVLEERKVKTGQSQFLQTDTHWTPEAMQAVARSLAAEIENSALTFQRPAADYHTRRQTITNIGDTARALSLPDYSQYSQTVTIEQVLDSRNRLWQPDASAEILLLGDSFSNIYTQPELGWGQSAGLGAQLSRMLKRPVDSIVVNAGGASTSRQRLAQEMRSNPERLKNKKVVIWQFSMRDLAFGDWKVVPLP